MAIRDATFEEWAEIKRPLTGPFETREKAALWVRLFASARMRCPECGHVTQRPPLRLIEYSDGNRVLWVVVALQGP